MKITIDSEKCQSQKRCFNLYPQLFEEGADSKGKVRDGLVIESDDDMVDAQSAANACPQAAINIEY